MKKKGLIDAIATVTGTTIGAGIFGLPYVFVKAGFLVGIINMIIIFFAILIINLYTARITLITKKPFELTSYIEKLIGKKGKHYMALLMMLSIIGALLAYIIGIGEAISAIFNLNFFVASLISFLILSIIVFFDLKGVKESETILTFFLIIVAILIIIFGFTKFDINNINFKSDFSLYNLYFPYGVILFSFLCLAALPEVRQEIKGNEKDLKKAIIIGTTIPLIIYILFVFAVVGVSGKNTTEIATIGFSKLGFFVKIFSNIFVILAMSTSFITLALALRWVLQYDYKINKFIAWFISCFIPLFLFLIGFRNFIKILSFTGSIAGGLQLILITIAAKKTEKMKNKYLKNFKVPLNNIIIFLLLLIFILGIIHQIIFLFK